MALSKSESGYPDNVTSLDTAREARKSEQPKKPVKAKDANRRFNTEKVERLKAAIADGSYEINARSVADKFIEREGNT